MFVFQFPANAFVAPPKTMRSQAEIDRWVYAHRGYSGDFIGKHDFTWKGNRVCLRWVSPFSGRSALKSWTYQRASADSTWYLVDTRLHEPPFTSVTLDSAKGLISFLARDGKPDGLLKLKLKP